MNRVSMVLLAGGVGKRMKMNVPKQLLTIGGKPIIAHVLEKIEMIDEIAEVIIPSPENYIEETIMTINDHQFSKPFQVIEGGSSRQESTYKALQHVQHEHVIIHEAVRPFVSKEEFIHLIHCEEENAIYGLDIPFTVLEGKEYIEGNLERDRLVNIQLPQKFNTEKLLAAHEKAHHEMNEFTEDASLYFHYYGENIKVLEGTEYNIKITKPIDRKVAEIIYKDYVLGREYSE
ncbi:IspD/TarI family cytidylyltransferase [Fictibacillus gelatini]|nr:IspD/TarI family cytidylyltransferase [Fictibacillus gelatini]